MIRQTRSGRFAKSRSARPSDKSNHLRAEPEPLENRAMLSAITWTVDSSQSFTSIAIPDQPFELSDGTTTYNGTLRIRDQGGNNDGSWGVGNSAQLSGTLATEYTDDISIEFLLGQSNLAAVNSGSYEPDPADWNGTDFGGNFNSGPGVYGGRIYPTINVLIPITATAGFFNFTDVVYDVGSPALDITGGSFLANTTEIGMSSVLANVKGSSIFLLGQVLPDAQEVITDLLATNQSASGSIVAPDPIGQPNFRELTLPIFQDFSIEISEGAPPFTGTITGQIVATATIPSTIPAFGRHLFYDNSKFDRIGFSQAPGINPQDSLAIATDKTAYLPGGGLIGTANMSTYSRGVNGIMIDLTGPHGTLSLADFEFAMSEQGFSANNTPSSWTAAPAPIAFTVLTDTPVTGTDRVEFIWADNAIEKRYLEVTTKGNDAAGGFNIHTGLAATDYFYYGSQVADDFLATGGISFITSAVDETDARANQGFGQPSTNIYDYDKDGIVGAFDQSIARSNGSFLARINITGPPPPAPAAGDDGSGSAVAQALAARSVDASSTPPAPGWLIHRLDAAANHRPTGSESPIAPAAFVAERAAGGGESESSVIDLALDDELLDSLLGEI